MVNWLKQLFIVFMAKPKSYGESINKRPLIPIGVHSNRKEDTSNTVVVISIGALFCEMRSVWRDNDTHRQSEFYLRRAIWCTFMFNAAWNWQIHFHLINFSLLHSANDLVCICVCGRICVCVCVGFSLRQQMLDFPFTKKRCNQLFGVFSTMRAKHVPSLSLSLSLFLALRGSANFYVSWLDWKRLPAIVRYSLLYTHIRLQYSFWCCYSDFSLWAKKIIDNVLEREKLIKRHMRERVQSFYVCK